PDGSKQLGPLARLTGTPASPGPDALPDDGLAAAWRERPRAEPTRSKGDGSPLAGIRVVELATIIAAPLGASFLADMGADVIKVEQIGGDPYRGLGAGIGSARVNAGKRSISVDLKSDAGREMVLRLIGEADVLIHNFRPGVPERLGIGYEQISAINSGIVYLQCNGYGPDGPSAERPSTHPIPGAAMGGVLYELGERVPDELQDMGGLRLWTRRMMRANEVNPDPNTALVVATSTLLGLVARQRTGEGQRIFVDMLGANAYANHDDFLAYDGKPGRAMPDEALLGLSATYRLYPCADDQWIFLALLNDAERRRFVDTLTEAGVEAPTVEVLAKGGVRASEALAALFAARDATYWEGLLAGAGIGCVRADAVAPSEFWLEDPQSEALGLTAEVEHPSWGAYRRHGPLVHFDGRSPRLGAPPLAGQHVEELLRGLGYDAERIAGLEADGIVWLALALRQQSTVVDPPRVKIAVPELDQLRPELADEPVAAEEHYESSRQHARPKLPILDQQVGVSQEDLGQEAERCVRHGQTSKPHGADGLLVHVEGHRLVLGFLHCVPPPQPLHGRVHVTRPGFGIHEDLMRADGGDVLDRGRQRQ
ncbi:MAG: CoA transferase, partial [Gammaproteobacteria bacterium]